MGKCSRNIDIICKSWLMFRSGNHKLIQAKYFGNVRDDIEIAECSVSQLKVKANDDQIES